MPRSRLGTQLRHLLELLDGAVQASYVDAGLDYRPRYTPVMRALLQEQPRSVSEIAHAAGISQPAATQTVALMVQDGLVTMRPAASDARVRLVRLTRKAHLLVPTLEACWSATQQAAQSLDDEMATRLSDVLEEAIRRLEAHPFSARIAETRRPALAGARR